MIDDNISMIGSQYTECNKKYAEENPATPIARSENCFELENKKFKNLLLFDFFSHKNESHIAPIDKINVDTKPNCNVVTETLSEFSFVKG